MQRIEDPWNENRIHDRGDGRGTVGLAAQVKPLGPDHDGRRVSHRPGSRATVDLHQPVAAHQHGHVLAGIGLDRSWQQVRYPDEIGDEDRARRVIDVLGRADLFHPALVHDRDAVRHGEGLFLIVGHVDEGDPHLALNSLQLDLHRLAQLQVEGAERLVEEERAGVVHQRPRQRHPLLLAAGELGRFASGELLQPDHFQQLRHPLLHVGLVELPAAGAEGDVVIHRHVGKSA